MNTDSKRSSRIDFVLTLFLLLAVVKFTWVVAEIFFLPAQGIDAPAKDRLPALPHRVRLASNETLKQETKPEPVRTPLKSMKLLATYIGPRQRIAVIAKGGKTYIEKETQTLLGYRIERIMRNRVELRRDGVHYQLQIEQSPLQNAVQSVQRKIFESSKSPSSSIVSEGGVIRVPRALLQRYAKNMDKIWKDIAIVPRKVNGKLTGFRIRFVKRGSVFDKLGLKRGDIITGINGEPLEDYSVPMELFGSLDTLDGLILNIRRGAQTLELDYEVQ